jgi:glutaredoxin
MMLVSQTLHNLTSDGKFRKAKDFLDDASIPYVTIELDLLPDNQGNEIRSELGKLSKRTSVPSIFIGGEYIGGCNDGNPGLLPLARDQDGKTLKAMLAKAGVKN